MGESAKAQKVFQILLKQATEEDAMGSIYHQLAVLAHTQGACKEAIIYHQRSIKIKEKQILSDYRSLASSYNATGKAYHSAGDYKEAFSSHEKALAIQQQSLPPNHPDLVVPYYNIGVMYTSMHGSLLEGTIEL